MHSAQLRVKELSSITSDRRQSKTLSTIDERGLNIDRNSAFDWRQMAFENTVSIPLATNDNRKHCFYPTGDK